MILNSPKSFQPSSKNVSYLNRDFNQLKQALINYATVYFPNTYKDFSAASPGLMYIEMAAFVGDVLGYYTDYQFKESSLINAEERRNIIDQAQSRGYKVKVTAPAIVPVDVYQLVPAKQNPDGSMSPDLSYSQIIQPGMTMTSDSGVGFITTDPIDFTVDTNNNPLSVSVYQRDASGQPQYYVLQKSTTATSGTIVTTNISIGAAVPFFTTQLNENNIINILDIYDSDGNQWYESDYLAQDLIPIPVENIYQNDNVLSAYRDSTPFLMQFIKTSRRFVTSVDENDKTWLLFGSGVNVNPDEVIIPNLNTVGQGTSFGLQNVSYDPANFLTSNSFGQAPSNTVLTIRYVIGGGIASNVNANSIKTVQQISFSGDISELPNAQQNLTTFVRNSIKVNNPEPACGGKDSETNIEIKNNALSSISTQNRAVTQADYEIRSYGMPAKFGAIAKAYAVTDSELSPNSSNNNPFAINLYVLAYDSSKRLIPTNPAMQQNLINYLKQYRMFTDSVRIMDGYIINIRVNFSIIAYKNYNKADVLNNCISTVSDFFNTDNIQFCQPISIGQLRLQIGNVDGVQSIAALSIENVTASDGDYSPNAYDIASATVNDVVYPSLDPAIFEVRFPTNDIRGRVI